VTSEDILLAFSILLLAVEIMKSTRIGMRAIIDHVLSMILFIAMLVEFLLLKQGGTSTFFILMVISMVDVMAGFIVTARTAQRDIEIERVEPSA
jgi:cobalamin synthase